MHVQNDVSPLRATFARDQRWWHDDVLPHFGAVLLYANASEVMKLVLGFDG